MSSEMQQSEAVSEVRTSKRSIDARAMRTIMDAWKKAGHGTPVVLSIWRQVEQGYLLTRAQYDLLWRGLRRAGAHDFTPEPHELRTGPEWTDWVQLKPTPTERVERQLAELPNVQGDFRIAYREFLSILEREEQTRVDRLEVEQEYELEKELKRDAAQKGVARV